MSYDVCTLGSGAIDETSGLTTVQATVPITGPDDVEQFGDVDMVSCLGVTSVPFPADDAGHAEGVIIRDVGNSEGIVVGARDERCSAVYGSLAGGDSTLHSTDPGAAAQVQAKATRQIVLITQGSNGKNAVIMIDGKNDKIQIAGFGGMIEMSEENGISLAAPGGDASIIIKNKTISLNGNVALGGAAAVPGVAFLAGGTAVEIAAALLKPVKGTAIPAL